MVPYTDTLFSEAEGPNNLAQPLPGVSVYVLRPDGTPEVLNGGLLAQPVVSDMNGVVSFTVPDPGNYYTLQYRYGGRLIRENNAVIGLPSIDGNVVEYVAGLGNAAAQALLVNTGALSVGTTFGDTVEAELRLAQPREVQKAFSPVLDMALKRVLPRLDTLFYNYAASPRHILPASGGPSSHTGLVSEAYFPTIWMDSQYLRKLYEEWLFAKSYPHLAPRSAEVLRAMLDEHAQYLMAKFGASSMASAAQADEVTISDDGAWKASEWLALYKATGRKVFYDAAIELIPAICQRFRDTHQATGQNPLIDYGYTTPGGIAFKSNTYGYLYCDPSDSASIAQYGIISTGYQVVTALVAYQLWELGADAAYRQFSIDTWTWMFGAMRTASTGPTDTDTGVYFCDFNLDTTSSGYKTPVNSGYGNPKRGTSAEFEAATMGMAILSARFATDPLMTDVQRAAYKAEAASIVQVYPHLLAFGRTLPNGKSGVAMLRDAWTGYHLVAETARIVFPLVGALATPLRLALLNTADWIMNGAGGVVTTTGYIGADWQGPETSPGNGTTSWLADSAQDANLDMADPRQIMTSAMGGLLIVSACFVAAAGVDYATTTTGVPNPSPVPNPLDLLWQTGSDYTLRGASYAERFDGGVEGKTRYWKNTLDGQVTPGNGVDGLSYTSGFHKDVLDTRNVGTGISVGDRTRHLFGGSSTKGGRIGKLVQLQMTGPTSQDVDNTEREYVALSCYTNISSGDGGTSTARKGGGFAFNPALYAASATNWRDLTCVEFNTFVDAASSADIISAASFAPSIAAVGSELDAYWDVGGQPGNLGSKGLIYLNDSHGGLPVGATTWLMLGRFPTLGVAGKVTIAGGYDFTSFILTSADAHKFNLGQSLSWYSTPATRAARVYGGANPSSATAGAVIVEALNSAGTLVTVALHAREDNSFAPSQPINLGAVNYRWYGMYGTFANMIEQAASTVPTPVAATQNLFIDSADHKLKRKDSTGTVTVIG